MGAANRVQGGIFTLMVVKVGDPYDPALEREIAEQVALSPGFFADAPVVLDLKDSLGCTSVADYTSLRQLLRRHGMIPVGVQNASALQLRAAKAVDLSAFSGASGGSAARRPAPAAERAPPAAEPARATPREVERAPPPREHPPAPRERAADRPAADQRTRLVTQPVRSGTQIYAKGGDLVVVAPVSAGAELIADGHIHVYGALRGRAIAGAMGDTNARIFAHRFAAELVSVAGRYIVSDAIPAEHLNQPAQVALIDDELHILAGWGG
ncbi:MAG TPA: septum site-determining protein MinC [Stellaceae bacterium]|nr:septum site-determining protein MinC [Stellaceae bacterium]